MTQKVNEPSWLDNLRLPDNYTNTIGGVKLPTKPSFGKLNKHRFSCDKEYFFEFNPVQKEYQYSLVFYIPNYAILAKSNGILGLSFDGPSTSH